MLSTGFIGALYLIVDRVRISRWLPPAGWEHGPTVDLQCSPRALDLGASFHSPSWGFVHFLLTYCNSAEWYPSISFRSPYLTGLVLAQNGRYFGRAARDVERRKGTQCTSSSQFLRQMSFAENQSEEPVVQIDAKTLIQIAVH
jgi:hypothetical protein